MPLDKAILHGKEHRKPYRRAKAVDTWCRNHGRCTWCTMQRLFARTKRERAAQDDLREANMTVDTNSPCPVCSGTFLANRQYEGFDAVMITEWVCDGCGRMVKVANPPKVPGLDARKPTDEEVE